GTTGRTIYTFVPQIDNGAGTVHFGACSVGSAPGPDGGGVLARVVFTVEACNATTALDLTDVILTEVDGWPVDLGSVTGGSLEIGCAADVPDGSQLLGYVLFPPRPNPASSTSEILFSLPADAGEGTHAQLDIFNATGRRIQRLLDRDLGAGLHRIVWDGREESGQLAPAGTYFCRLSVAGRVRTTQLQLVR
ncbi:MAG: hypothetical protein KC729_13750, partial [Candidatus Eisenbacteria bacterium]|nr:hypothetical protein [Candidatus Eisenbacteria bacterium]